MSDVKIVHPPAQPLASRGAKMPVGSTIPTVDDVFRMPTREEFVAAGYKLERYGELLAERNDLVQRFNADPEFRAAAIQHYQERQKAKANL